MLKKNEGNASKKIKLFLSFCISFRKFKYMFFLYDVFLLWLLVRNKTMQALNLDMIVSGLFFSLASVHGKMI